MWLCVCVCQPKVAATTVCELEMPAFCLLPRFSSHVGDCCRFLFVTLLWRRGQGDGWGGGRGREGVRGIAVACEHHSS